MIHTLTPEQSARLPEFREAWLKVGLSTDPCDMPRFKAAFDEACDLIGQRRRKVFWYCQSPIMACILISVWPELSKSLDANLGANLRANLDANLGANLWANLRANLWDNLGDNLGDNLWDNLGDNLRANLRANLWDNLGDNLDANLWDNLGDNLRANLRDNLWANLRDNLWDNLEANLDANLRANLRDNLWDNLEANLDANLRDNLGDNLWANLRDNLRDNLDANLRDNLGANLRYVTTYWWGQMDVPWIAYFSFCESVLGLRYSEKDTKLLRIHQEICRSVGWWWPYDDIVFVSDRPSFVGKDAIGRLHCETGPALLYRDGYCLWYIHGVEVNQKIVMEPETITIADIEAQPNAEIRRVMIDRFGTTRFLTEGGSREVHRDDFGTLYRKELFGDEPLVMVRVINGTVDPSEGTAHEFFLRVPPTVKTAREAVAWTYGRQEKDYSPSIRT